MDGQCPAVDGLGDADWKKYLLFICRIQLYLVFFSFCNYRGRVTAVKSYIIIPKLTVKEASLTKFKSQIKLLVTDR